MKFLCFSSWAQLPLSAHALFASAEKQSIFLSRAWLERVSRAEIHPGHRMMLACVVTKDSVVALMPLLSDNGKTWYALKHRYTPHFSLLLTGKNQVQVLACLARGLRQLPLNGLFLEPVVGGDSLLDGFEQQMQSLGFRCDRRFRHYNWIYRLHGQSFEDYMAARPAWLRNIIARKSRKLEREHGYNIRLLKGHEVPQAMSDYYAIFKASWKANEQFVDFVDDTVAAFSAAGWTRLAILDIKGTPAAAQLWFVCQRKASIFRLAYDEKWRRYSPGSLLTRHLMEYVIDIDKVEEIDFLTGNEAYKQDWMSERRECYSLGCMMQEEPLAWYTHIFSILRKRQK